MIFWLWPRNFDFAWFYWQIFVLNGVPCELEALFGIWATIKSFWNLNTTNSCLDFITTFCHFSMRSCHLSIFPFPLSFTLVSPGTALSTICQAVYCCFLTRLALSQIGQTSGLDWDQVLFQSPLGDPVILMGLFQVSPTTTGLLTCFHIQPFLISLAGFGQVSMIFLFVFDLDY